MKKQVTWSKRQARALTRKALRNCRPQESLAEVAARLEREDQARKRAMAKPPKRGKRHKDGKNKQQRIAEWVASKNTQLPLDYASKPAGPVKPLSIDAAHGERNMAYLDKWRVG